MTLTGPPLVMLDTVEARPGVSVQVVRDDIIAGGTKARVLPAIFKADADHDEFVFGGPAQGYAQVALAYAARDAGKASTYFVAKRKALHPLTAEARAAGCQIIEVPAGRLSNVQAKARRWCEARPRSRFLPLGFDIPEFHAGLIALAEGLPVGPPPEVWVTAGSGALSRALQAVWPAAAHHAVQIGFAPQTGSARLWQAPERFEQEAEEPPPFPSCVNYDAKLWRFVRRYAQPGALVWNVGA